MLVSLQANKLATAKYNIHTAKIQAYEVHWNSVVDQDGIGMAKEPVPFSSEHHCCLARRDR